MTDYLPIILLALLLIAGAAYAASRKRHGQDIDIPAPDVLRTDLLYGYYGTLVDDTQDQVAETADHVNLVWLWDFLSAAESATILKRMPGVFGVLDCCAYLFERADGRVLLRPDAEQRLRAAFAHLRDAGVLHQINMLVPIDEPNLSANETVIGHLPAAAEIMRRVAGEFDETRGVLLGCIYLGGKRMPHIGLWDVVGFDIYGRRSGIFEPGGRYDQMKRLLRPDQRTIILPGGYSDHKQAPTPFINFAHRNPEVMIVLPFLWCTVPWEKFRGIRDLPDIRPLYEAAGRAIVEAGRDA